MPRSLDSTESSGSDDDGSSSSATGGLQQQRRRDSSRANSGHPTVAYRDSSRGADSRHPRAPQQHQHQQQQPRRGSSSSSSSRDERALRTTRLLSLEVGSLKAELLRERQKRCTAVERAEAAEAAQQSAQERVAELQFATSRLAAQVEGLREEAAAKGRQVAQLKGSLAATDTRVARGQLQVQQLKDAASQLRSLLAACCSFNTSTLHMHCRSTCSQPAVQLLQQLQTALGRMQDTLEGKAAPADAPPPLQDQDQQQQHAAAFGPLLSAQLRPGSPRATPASAPGAASALGSPCNVGRHSASSWEQGQQQPASMQQLADKASVEAARLQLSQDAERAALQQQLAAAHAEAAGLRVALGRRQAAEGQQQHDAADTLIRLAGRLSLAQQQQREAQLTGVAAGVAVGASSLLQTGSVSIGSRLESQSKLLGAVGSRPGSAGLGSSASRFGAPFVRPLSSGGGVSSSFSRSRSPSPGRYSSPGFVGGSPASPAARASALHTTATIAGGGGASSPLARRRYATAVGSTAAGGGLSSVLPATRSPAKPSSSAAATATTITGSGGGSSSIGAQRASAVPLSVGSPPAAADVAAHSRALVAEADAALQRLAACRLGTPRAAVLRSSAGALRNSFEAAAVVAAGAGAAVVAAGAGSPLRSLLTSKSTVSPSKEATVAAGLRALDRDIAQAEASLSAAAARLSQPGGGLRDGHSASAANVGCRRSKMCDSGW